jgi:phosphoglycolate phosphatase-like HAD superfamily hydrolase
MEDSSLPSSSLRILLWDIDGTLVRSAREGAFKSYTVPLLEAVFGTAGRLNEMRVSGMTDLQIIAEALRDENFTPQQIRSRLHELRTRYMQELERVAGMEENLFYALPGAHEILAATSAHPRYLNALLTGNIELAAHFKMRVVGLHDFFQLPGAFGDDSHDRRDLPALAAARINRALDFKLAPAQFIIIGDTPNDIACAKHFGARSVAVATSRYHNADELLTHQPDALIPDLSDTESVLKTLDALQAT